MGLLLESLYVVSALVAFALLLSRILERGAPNTHYFSLLTLAVFMSNLGHLFEVIAANQNDAIIAMRLRFIGAPFIAPFLLFTVLVHCGIDIKRRILVSTLIMPLITMSLAVTWPGSGVFLRNVSFTHGPVISRLVLYPSVYYYVYQSYNTFIILVADALLVYYCFRKDNLFVKQSIIFILASLPPLASVIFTSVGGGNILGFDLSPLLIGVGCLMIGFSYYRFGFYRVAPIARDQMVEAMSDGFIIMDSDMRFVDANPAAKRILPVLNAISPGSHVWDFDEISWLCDSRSSRNHEIRLRVENDADRYYRVSETEVTRGHRVIGRCIVLYDFTETRRLLDEVSSLAERDGLTKLFNRRSLYIHGVRLFDMLIRSGGSACMLMIDIDDFKKINDTFGHPVGDEVLRTLSDLLTSRFRVTDLVTRYGGEEFCVFLPNMPESAALETADTLRKRVQELEFSAGNSSFHITISIGLAAYDPARHKNLDMMITDADMALYAAKNNGKNAVFVTHSDASEGKDAGEITLIRFN